MSPYIKFKSGKPENWKRLTAMRHNEGVNAENCDTNDEPMTVMCDKEQEIIANSCM